MQFHSVSSFKGSDDMTQEQEFLNGWSAAEADEASGKGERKTFAPYRTGAFIEGYTSFFDTQRLEIEQAERECADDYDARQSKGN